LKELKFFAVAIIFNYIFFHGSMRVVGLLFGRIGGIFVMQPHLNKISKNNKQIVPIAPFMGDSDAHDWDISMFF